MDGEQQTDGVVIVGIGDERQRDDAVGLFMAEELTAGPLPADVRVEQARTESFNLLAVLDDAKRALILAAVRTGREPGTIHVFSPADAEANADYISDLGDTTLIDALELARMRGGPKVLIVGIEPAEIMPGQTLHPDVEASVEEAAEIVRELATGEREWRFFARGDFD